MPLATTRSHNWKVQPVALCTRFTQFVMPHCTLRQKCRSCTVFAFKTSLKLRLKRLNLK